MAIQFNMFSLLVDDNETNKNMEYYFVVTIKSHMAIMVDAKVPEKLLKQNEFTCGGRDIIFGLSRGVRDTSLLLELPRDGVVTQKTPIVVTNLPSSWTST